MNVTIPAYERLRRLAVLTFLLLAARGFAVAAAEFRLGAPEAATSKQIDETLAAGRAHRTLHPEDVIVILLPARLALTAPIILSADDSGRPQAPLILRGAAAGGSTISGATPLDAESRLDPSSQPLSRMPRSVQGWVRRARVPDEVLAKTQPAFSPSGSFMQGASGRLFIFEGERRLVPAHWPAIGYATSPAMVSGAPDRTAIRLPVDVAGLENESDLWVSGFWGWNWWFETRKVDSAMGRIITFSKLQTPVRPGARFRLFNLAAGLDRSGVYYWDAEDDGVYFLPAGSDRGGRLTVPVVDTLLKISGAANVRVENVAFEKTIGSAVSIENATNITMRDCYVGHTGGDGIVVYGGADVSVENCIIDDIGQTGVAISGGDRDTLTPARHVVRDSRITNFGREAPTYRPGIRIDGVGVTVEGCEIADASHAGVIFSGNDHRIVGNDLHDLVLDTDDSGAIYAGRNWTARGAVILSNYIHDVTDKVDPSNVMGVYLDDQLSGAEVDANVFYNVDEPILVGGGRDNVVRDNLLLASKGGPIGFDSRGLNWQADMARPGGALVKGLDSVPYRVGVWARRYPQLVDILDDRPGAPVNNSFVDNLGDRLPMVKYDRPETAAYGVEIGNRQIVATAFDFPASLPGVPPDAAAAPALERTRAEIEKTMRTMRNLPFRSKLTD